MARYIFLVQTNPVEGREQEYNDWYTNQHLDDVLTVDGFVAAQRFQLCSGDGMPGGKPYVAIYEIDAESAEAAQAALSKVSGSGAMFISESLDRDGVVAAYYRPISERKVAKTHAKTVAHAG